MPIGYRIDEDLEIVFVRIEGVLTEDEMAAVAAALRADPRFRPTWPSLTDARNESAVRLRTSFLRSYESPFGPYARRAVLVGQDVSFGMKRLYEAIATTPGVITVTRDLAKALEWLGLPPSTPLPDELDTSSDDPSLRPPDRPYA